jgi:hypothetical protein
MWRLKIAEGGGDPWLRTNNGHVGRQVWEFDAAAEPDPAVDAARGAFAERRHDLKHSADLPMRIQVITHGPPPSARPPVLVPPPPRTRGCRGRVRVAPPRPVAIAGGWRGAVGLAPAGAVRLTGTRGGEGLRPEGCCLADSCGPPYGDFAPTGFQCEASEPNFGILEGVNARCAESRRDGLSRRLQRTSITAFVLIVPVLGCAFDSFYNVCPVVQLAILQPPLSYSTRLFYMGAFYQPRLCSVL